ncbi:hypothetical protein PTTG_12481 [Puccinia triticina 1-1 BBBD Race 1]|uniref:DDE-1 domain-containing protein n=1 Tax=Puccinia triticina (isolate 1-1 / race 1 (BBBD)) TaxID=630390 RepID=A0A180GBB8_PUCT1|nr:hypothetical protein PTTG_12481 [Puccinia triticina 1-1 BBBD Race 1]
MFENYFIRHQPVRVEADPTIDPNLESATLDDSNPSNSSRVNHNLPMLVLSIARLLILVFIHHKSDDACLLNQEAESLDDRLDSLLEKYLAAPKEPTSGETNDRKAREKWQELNSALDTATATYRRKEKKEKNFKFPQLMIKNLYHFNNLRLKYSLDGTPAPSAAASLAAAQAAINQRSFASGTAPKARSGIYLARSIQFEARHVINNKSLLEVKRGNRKTHHSLLDNAKLRKELLTWAASQTPGHVTPLTFREYTLHTVFPQFDINRSLSRQTATRWMIRLGYRPQEYRKCLYFDGHERPDVIEARKKYIKEFDLYRKRSRIYGGDDLDMAPQVDPAALGDGKETVFIYHDESTIHAKEKPKSSWLLPGTTELRSKSAGRLIHISDFILETTGRLKLSAEQFAETGIESDDAATIIYPGSNGDKWWDMEQLCHQVAKKAIPVFELLHPNCQAVFVFDCSSAHGAFSKSALRVQNMNLSPGGKQSRLQDSVIPCDDPHIPQHLRGLAQTFVYDSLHPDPKRAGKPKGIQVILEERGLWDYYNNLRLKERKPALKLRCDVCSKSNARKDALVRSEKLIRQAEATGYLLSEEQCVEELMVAEGHCPEDMSNQPNLTAKSVGCCWSNILSHQSDFRQQTTIASTYY